jgi:hypothetical protein
LPRISSHGVDGQPPSMFLQCVARKCTKVGNEQPSKQSLKNAPKVRQIG